MTMWTRSLRGMVAVSAIAAGFSIAPLARGQTAADTASARDLFNDGTQLAQAGKLQDARDRFERSLRLKRAGVTFYSLGVVQKRLGLYVEASESLRAFLAEPPIPQNRPFEDPARDAIHELQTKLAHVRVMVIPESAPDVHIKVDGQDVPDAARIVPREVNPGKHRVDVTARGFAASTQNLELREGQSGELTFTLKAEAAAPTPTTAPAGSDSAAPMVSTPAGQGSAAPPAAANDAPPIVPIAVLAGGGAFLITGIIVGALGVSQAKSAPTRDGSEASSAKTKGVISDVLGGVGIVGLAVGGYLLLTGSKTGDAAASASLGRVVVWGSGSTAGVRIAF